MLVHGYQPLFPAPAQRLVGFEANTVCILGEKNQVNVPDLSSLLERSCVENSGLLLRANKGHYMYPLI